MIVFYLFLGSTKDYNKRPDNTSENIICKKNMARHKRGHFSKQQRKYKNSTINNLNDKNIIDKKYFPDNQLTNIDKSGPQGFVYKGSKQSYVNDNDFSPNNNFNLRDGTKRQRRQMSSNFSSPSSFSANKKDIDDGSSLYVNSNKSEFRPIAVNSSTIDTPRSSIAELVMKGEIDHSLARVTTGRPTIIIYPTGNILFKCSNENNFEFFYSISGIFYFCTFNLIIFSSTGICHHTNRLFNHHISSGSDISNLSFAVFQPKS